RGRALRVAGRQVTHARAGPVCGIEVLHQAARAGVRAVVTDDDFIGVSGKILGHERSQAAPQQFGTPARGHHDRYEQFFLARIHRGFSSRYEPMTSASRGEVQKHSTASRGEHTTGSPRVLNDVFTSTGTPVRRSKAAS